VEQRPIDALRSLHRRSSAVLEAMPGIDPIIRMPVGLASKDKSDAEQLEQMLPPDRLANMACDVSNCLLNSCILCDRMPNSLDKVSERWRKPLASTAAHKDRQRSSNNSVDAALRPSPPSALSCIIETMDLASLRASSWATSASAKPLSVGAATPASGLGNLTVTSSDRSSGPSSRLSGHVVPVPRRGVPGMKSELPTCPPNGENSDADAASVDCAEEQVESIKFTRPLKLCRPSCRFAAANSRCNFPTKDIICSGFIVLFTIAMACTSRVRVAKRKEDRVTSACWAQADAVTSRVVRQLPPNDSSNTRVNTESR